jgi:hypothetical protein
LQTSHPFDWVAAASLWVGAAALLVSMVALIVACYAIFRSNRNSSVATLVTLNEAYREAWDRFLNNGPDDKARYRKFCELMNLIETGCGIVVEGSLSGVSKKMITIYLNDVLELLIENDYAKAHVPEMMHSPTTFECLKAFLKSKAKYLSVTIPPEWYQITD